MKIHALFVNVVSKGNGGFVENNVALEIKFFDRCRFIVQQQNSIL